MGVAIAYVDGPRLRRSLLAAVDWLVAGREELNRINVFPVPDGDTGTNFALTVRSIAEALHRLRRDAPLHEVTRAVARASVLGARGNSGMMLSHFLLGFSDGVGQRVRVRSHELADAIRRGFERLAGSLERPVEGTILTVCREAATGAERAAREEPDIYRVIRRTLESAEQALARTPELLEVLRQNGVVDAGGKGFVRMLEGVVRLIHGEPVTDEHPVPTAGLAPAATAAVEADQDYRFCTEVLVRGDGLPGSVDARAQLACLGGSLIVLRTADLLRVHIHTDDAAGIFQLAETWGEVLSKKADDMREQHRLLTTSTRAVAVLCDSSCDLPDDVLDQNGIGLIPLQLLLGDEVYEDRVGISAEEFYRRLRAGDIQPTTSQPTPAAFTAAFEHARAEAQEVVTVLISSALSGTFANAEAARRAFAPGGVHLVDSKSASFGVGLLALRGAELAADGWGAAAIGEELNRVRRQSGMFFTVDTLDNLLRSGRVTRFKALLAGFLDLKPILTLSDEGAIVPVDRVRGQRALLPRVLKLLDRAMPRGAERLRMGVAHADVPHIAEEIRHELERRYRPVETLVSPVTGVIATHAGPGAWGVFYQVEDGTPDAPRNKSDARAL